MRTLARLIQAGRADHYWSVDELAERSGLPAPTIWQLIDPEPCLRVALDSQTIHALADALTLPRGLLARAAYVDSCDDPLATLTPTQAGMPSAGTVKTRRHADASTWVVTP